MSSAQLLTIGSAQTNVVKQIFPNLPILSSHQTAWSGLHLEYHQQPAHETPEFYLAQHLVSIYVGPPGTKLMMNGHWQREGYRHGDMMIFPAEQYLRTGWDHSAEFIKLYLDPAMLSHRAGAGVATKHFELAPRLKLQDPLIHQIGLTLKSELESIGGGDRLYVETMINALFVHLLRRYSNQEVVIYHAPNGLANHKLKAVISYINESLEQELSLNELAAVVQISPHYFAGLFKRATGISPHQYVMQCRIQRAKQLLVRRELEIVDVCQQVGFQNQSHFTRVFRRYTATTPKAYRNAL